MKFRLPIHLLAIAMLAFTFLGMPVSTHAQTSCNYYVSTAGNDSNAGTQTAPWRTIQKSANTAGAGQTVCVRGGVYNEVVVINVSGSASGGYVTFMSYPSETAILDGTGLTVPSGWGPMIRIENKSYITIQGFEIRNYRSSLKAHSPIGIFVTGYDDHIQLLSNMVHDMGTSFSGKNGGDAHGIAVYGTAAPNSINNIVIDGNQLYNLSLGSSESLVVNGNVDGFTITNNLVHDNNNIGIDVIGFEGKSPDPTYDQARNGTVIHNTVYNINSYGNPAYGNERSADGIYVDGGRDTLIERNVVHHTNIGIELASEHAGRATSNITVRNNFFYSNTQVGVAFGGYDKRRGSTENCVIVNNTFYNNATQGDWGAELYVQFDTRNNIVENNIFFANSARKFIESWSAVMTGNVVDYNLYFAVGGGDNGSFIWKNVTYTTFAAYQAGSGNDSHGLMGVDPLFVSLATPDLHLQSTSPAIDRGLNLTQSGTLDIDGQPRLQGVAIDLGADEVR
jgi:parallel beta helix pectate lyase-like protein